MKTILILALLLAMLFIMMGQNPVDVAQVSADRVAAQVNQKLHPVDCGAAPGAVSLGERIAWGLCVSAQSADQDAKAGR